MRNASTNAANGKMRIPSQYRAINFSPGREMKREGKRERSRNSERGRGVEIEREGEE